MRVYSSGRKEPADRNPLSIFLGQRNTLTSGVTNNFGQYTCPANRRARFQSHVWACITTALAAGQTLNVFLLDAASRETGNVFFPALSGVDNYRQALNAPFEVAATNSVQIRGVMGVGAGVAEAGGTLYGVEYDAPT